MKNAIGYVISALALSHAHDRRYGLSKTKSVLAVLALLLGIAQPAKAVDINLVINIIECESSGRYNAVGDGGLSVGIAQFREETFNRFKLKARMPRLRWKNPIDQLRLMVWMIDHGYGNHWTCYRVLMDPMD